jgi:uncharacterized membrane protein YhiD involved in acid resistance
MNELTTVFGPARMLAMEQVVASMLLSFALASVFAGVYRWTFRGFSYSRTFVHAMILGSMITSMLIMAIGNNLARGLGILGTLAIIRFRTQIRDPRDIIFLFGCLAIGISCGSQVFDIAIIGTLTLSAAALYLHYAPFASRRSYEGMLRFHYPAGRGDPPELTATLSKFCSEFSLIALREAVQGERVEYAYHARLIDPSYQPDLIAALQQVPEVSNVNLVMHRQTVEL